MAKKKSTKMRVKELIWVKGKIDSIRDAEGDEGG